MDERESAYGEVVAGLLAARESPATRRFDEALTAAVAAGLLDADAARTLRWWQRASVREVADHARVVLPAAFASLVESATSAADAVIVADDAWEDAGGRRLASGRHARSPEVAGRPDTKRATDPPKIATPAASPSDTDPAREDEPTAADVGTEPAPTVEAAPGASEPAADAESPSHTAPATAPATAPPPAAPAATPADASLRRRLVVAGLTRTG